jgi:integration host factor subunit beta
VTRKDLALDLARRLNLDPDDAMLHVNTFFDVMLDALSSGDRIEVRGFGAFQIMERSAHTSRNPKTGESLEVGVRRTVKFKPGKVLQSRLREAGFKALEEKKRSGKS